MITSPIRVDRFKEGTMSSTVTALPVTVEQIAFAVRRMSRGDQQQLLDLVPDLRQLAGQPPLRTLREASANVYAFRAEVLAALDGRPLLPDEPFIGGGTLAGYEALSDDQRATLWDDWAQIDMMDLEEIEVNADGLSAG